MFLDLSQLDHRLIGRMQSAGILPTPLSLPPHMCGPLAPPLPPKPVLTVDALKDELTRVDARKATLEKQIAYVEANPGALELLQEIARR